jgi:hypothetical protein
MGHILEKIKFFFLPFYMDLHYKALVWVIFWGKLKNLFLRFEWTYTIRLRYGSYFGEN